MAIADIPSPPHPFYPPELNLVGYVANEWSMLKLLTVFFGSCGIYLATVFVLARSFNPKLNGKDLSCVVWFVLSKLWYPGHESQCMYSPITAGTIHFFFEGYFAINHYRMPGQQDLFGQLWKEYARSDSRYLFSDPFVLCMESITAVSACWGHEELTDVCVSCYGALFRS